MKKDLQVEKIQRLPLRGCRLSRPAMALTWRFLPATLRATACGNASRTARDGACLPATLPSSQGIGHEMRDQSASLA
jgi:hypothetical protein